MPSLELRPRLRVIHYAELIWFFFCLGVVVYYLYPLVQTRPFLELLQTQWLVCLFGFVCLFLAVLPFQWKRHYFLRLDGQVLEKWEGWPFCSVQQRIHLGEIESVDVETVIPSSSRHTKEYLAFVLRPKSFTHQEIVHIPLPVGSEEHASEVFLHALRQVIKK